MVGQPEVGSLGQNRVGANSRGDFSFGSRVYL